MSIFELLVESIQIKILNKELDKYIKIKKKLDRQRYFVNTLISTFNETYDTNIKTI